MHALFGAVGDADDRGLRTPGSSLSTRSTSSGKMLSPSGVTIISFLRPLMNRRPCSSRSPMSPVCNQPSLSNTDSGFGIRGSGSGDLGFADLGCWDSFVVATRDVLAAHENFAVVGDAHLDAFDGCADRSPARLERMIQRDDRRCFGEPVPLDNGEAERRQNSSRSGGSGAAPTTNAQNFSPNAEWARRYRHHRPGMEMPCGRRLARPRARRASRARAARRASWARRRAPRSVET